MRRPVLPIAFGLTLACLCLAVAAAAGEPEGASVKLACTRDVWISSYKKENTNSMGRTERLKMKFLEEFFLLDFDWTALKGKRVAESGGWLYLRVDEAQAAKGMQRLKLGHLLDELKGVPVRWVGVSTVSSHWVEGVQAEEYKDDPEGRGATFDEASFGAEPWAWPGSRPWDVIHGNGNSVGARTEAERLDGYWFRVPVSRAQLETLRAEGGHGLWLSEDTFPSGGEALDLFVHSRESKGCEPYLVVQIEGDDAQAPEAPAVVMEPAPEASTTSTGALRLQFVVPEDAAAFHVRVDGKRLEPWQVARPGTAGASQTLVLRDLPPERELAISFAVADGAGNVSAAVEQKVASAAALPIPPALPEPTFKPQGGEPPARDGKLKVWAVPECVKTDPVRGTVHFEGQAGAIFHAKNPVWDGATGTIRLVAARGELVGVELIFERAGEEPVEEIRVELRDLAGADGKTFPAAAHARKFRTWYVKPKDEYLSEYAIPDDGPLSVPFAKNEIPGQKHQGLLLDFHVPPETAPGAYAGKLGLSARGIAPFELELRLEVFPATLPGELSFNPELNSYGPPGGAGSDYYYAAHKLAHYHRCTLNTLPYSQSGKIREPWDAPVRDGKVADWSAFDKTLGPLLDGSLFKDNPRAGVPVKTFYLGFFEQYPEDFTKHFKWKKPGANAAQVTEYRLLGPKPAEAFEASYRELFASVVDDYAKHFAAKGWTRAEAQFYLNNKDNEHGKNFWHLDEPASEPDYQALAEWGRMWREGLKNHAGVPLYYRADVSRPYWAFGQLDGLVDHMYVNGRAFSMPRTIEELHRRNPYRWYVYGSCNAPGKSNLQSAAWCLKAWALGAEGVLPWNATGKPDFKKGNDLALITAGEGAGHAGPVASLRVLALRRGAQDAELLRLWMARKKWTLGQAAALVSTKVPLASEFKQAFDDDAAAVDFEHLSVQGFAELKEGLLRTLSE